MGRNTSATTISKTEISQDEAHTLYIEPRNPKLTYPETHVPSRVISSGRTRVINTRGRRDQPNYQRKQLLRCAFQTKRCKYIDTVACMHKCHAEIADDILDGSSSAESEMVASEQRIAGCSIPHQATLHIALLLHKGPRLDGTDRFEAHRGIRG